MNKDRETTAPEAAVNVNQALEGLEAETEHALSSATKLRKLVEGVGRRRRGPPEPTRDFPIVTADEELQRLHMLMTIFGEMSVDEFSRATAYILARFGDPPEAP